MMTRRFRLMPAALAVAVMLAGAQVARACATCFGDPESNIAKGAVAGVVVLGAITYCLLMLVAGTGLFWYVRSRRLARLDGASADRE